MKNETLSRLKSYGLSGSALVLSSAAVSQVEHFDIFPQETIRGDGTRYNLDLNNDGIDDFEIRIVDFEQSSEFSSFSSNAVKITPLNSNGVLNSFSGYPYRLDDGASINQGAGNWDDDEDQIIANEWKSYTFSVYGYNTGGAGYVMDGNFTGFDENGYVGLRLKTNGGYLYGWMRLTIENSNVVRLENYSCETSANATIETDDSPNPISVVAGSVFELRSNDKSSSTQELKLEINFDAAQNEQTIEEYRVFVVKKASAKEYTLEDANDLALDRYKVVDPSGAESYTVDFETNDVDAFGVELQSGSEYIPIVLSVAGGAADLNNLTKGVSNGISLSASEQGVYLKSIRVTSAEDALVISKPNQDLIHFRLFDLNGKLMLQQEINASSVKVPTSTFASGIYVVHLQSGIDQKSEKVFIKGQ